MLGFVRLVGRAEVTTFVGFDVARVDPSAFDAMTCERILKPASACRSVYVLFAAFEIR
jgi:hypothetical protein